MLDKIIQLYQDLTGKKIPESQLPIYQAWANRAIKELEGKLGWSFETPSPVNILGCTKGGCDCDIDVSKLAEAPEVKGSCRFFSFSSKQPFVHTDPFTKVHAVYLCRVEPEGINITSNDGDVVILKKIEKFAPRYFSGTFGKYIQACQEMTICQQMCNQDCTNCTALLLDADWLTLENVPDELLYLICDYIDWMATGGQANRGLKSESVDGHSVSYRDLKDTLPYLNPSDATVIQLYAGPYGMVGRKLIW